MADAQVQGVLCVAQVVSCVRLILRLIGMQVMLSVANEFLDSFLRTPTVTLLRAVVPRGLCAVALKHVQRVGPWK